MKQDVLSEKSFDFAKKIVALAREIQKSEQEFVISKQLLRSGTSIGANIYEGKYAASRADFIYKMRIALKEGNETRYWIKLIAETICSDKREELSSLSSSWVCKLNCVSNNC